jgi:hypothetical protein
MVRSVARSLESSTTGDQRLSNWSSRDCKRGRKRCRASSDRAKRAATIHARRSSPSMPGFAAEAAAMRGSRLTVATSSSTTAGTSHSPGRRLSTVSIGSVERCGAPYGGSDAGTDGKHANTRRTFVCVAQRVRPSTDRACRTPSSESANGCGGASTRGGAPERVPSGPRPSVDGARRRGGRGLRRTLGDCSPQTAKPAGVSRLASTQPPCMTDEEGRGRGTLQMCHARWHALCL